VSFARLAREQSPWMVEARAARPGIPSEPLGQSPFAIAFNQAQKCSIATRFCSTHFSNCPANTAITTIMIASTQKVLGEGALICFLE